MKIFGYAAALAVAATVTLSGPKLAYGELVFEDDLKNDAAPAAQQKRADDAASLTKAEEMRRHRLRQELKNEDLLTQKLEELRLKDEMKRTDELSGGNAVSGVSKA
ncbi:MAG: hypothetical protein HY075_06580, partial [Deltaproteobacteria bacterium]|nr:hypothetical protein [Deltaproteobacteria bacterium]